MKQLITDFLKKYGTKVKKRESSRFVELMMDDHICVEVDYVQYYIPENNSSYTEDEDLVYEFLMMCRSVGDED
jgi:hypothetical protein